MSAVQILPANREDVPILHAISHLAFANDSHTLFKMHEKPCTMEDEMNILEMYKTFDGAEQGKSILTKAVLDGEIVGFAGWGFYNLDGERDGEAVSVLMSQTRTLQALSLRLSHPTRLRPLLPTQSQLRPSR